jgi:trehalose-6-phosphate synthase
MTDIVKKLRSFERFLKDPKPGEHVIKSDIFDEAADEIERLREENKQLTYRLARIDGTYDTMFSVVKALGEKE